MKSQLGVVLAVTFVGLLTGCGELLKIQGTAVMDDDAQAEVQARGERDGGGVEIDSLEAESPVSVDASMDGTVETGSRTLCASDDPSTACVIDCRFGGCVPYVKCPPGRSCLVQCASGTCPHVACAQGQRCIFDCDSSLSCRHLLFDDMGASSVCIRCRSCDTRVCSGSGCSATSHGPYVDGCDSSCATTEPECVP